MAAQQPSDVDVNVTANNNTTESATDGLNVDSNPPAEQPDDPTEYTKVHEIHGTCSHGSVIPIAIATMVGLGRKVVLNLRGVPPDNVSPTFTVLKRQDGKCIISYGDIPDGNPKSAFEITYLEYCTDCAKKVEKSFSCGSGRRRTQHRIELSKSGSGEGFALPSPKVGGSTHRRNKSSSSSSSSSSSLGRK